MNLDKIYPNRDIVAMKTNNIASYSDVLVTCMRQNPKWILLSEVRSAEAVSAVRNSISSGHNILSTIHSDKASAIPHRMYSLMESELDVEQFLNTIYRYVQLGVHIKAYYSKKYGKFHREIDEITEFYVDEDNKPVYNILYQKLMNGKIKKKNPSQHLVDYLLAQNIDLETTTFDDSEDDGGISIDDVMNNDEVNNGENSNIVEEKTTTNLNEMVNPQESNEQVINSDTIVTNQDAINEVEINNTINDNQVNNTSLNVSNTSNFSQFRDIGELGIRRDPVIDFTNREVNTNQQTTNIPNQDSEVVSDSIQPFNVSNPAELQNLGNQTEARREQPRFFNFNIDQ